MSSTQPTSFAKTILEWHSNIDRNLPWKSSNDPYRIWLSEIIMQQTRVVQGTPYYLRFVEAFPTVSDLANAAEDSVMKLWQGLGYYSRARNLHHTAKIIRDDYDGIFPKTYKEVLALKGIGPYTAAAICSFAYGHEHAVVDGNVIRTISRYFGITDPVDHSTTMKEINTLANKLIKGSNPADYNQAIMDFGALMCSPKAPTCLQCPLNQECVALGSNQTMEIPFKSKKIKKTDRYFHYFHIIDSENNQVFRHRNKNDIWKSLYDFPCIENSKQTSLGKEEITSFIRQFLPSGKMEIIMPHKVFKHVLSHQNIFAIFYTIILDRIPEPVDPYYLASPEKAESLAIPALLSKYMQESNEPTLF